ncbi:MAG: twin-arginine translocation signal domain-containing protein [Coriobacteriia bacterium]
MEASKLSRRQFLGGTAAVAAAAVIPAVAGVAPAVATPAGTLSAAAAALTPWVPIDGVAAAKQGYEIYKGVHGALGQGG